MRIGINCLEINPNYVAGVNSYTFGLLNGFAQTDDTHTFQLYVRPKNRHVFKAFESDPRFEIIVLKNQLLFRKILAGLLNLNSATLYRVTRNFLYAGITRKLDATSDIIYIPTTILFTYNHRKPTVLSMHDIQQVHFPEFFTKSQLQEKRIIYGLSAQYASYLQASSNYIKSDLLNHFSFLKENQVCIVPEGVDIEKFQKTTDTAAVVKKYALPDHFLLYPAQLWHHKNHLFLFKALQELQEAKNISIPLVLTGAAYSSSNFVLDYIKQHQLNVYYLGKVPLDDLIALYQKAKFLIHASLHESSCLPILEAAAAGTPVIASNIEPNVEMAKNLKLNLFDLRKTINLVNLLNELWNNESLIQEQADYNRAHIHLYSWKNAALKYIQLFEKIKN